MSEASERAAARYSQPALKEALTCEHLESTFRDEAAAAIECAYFSRIAEIEGEPEMARALRELGEQHSINAKGSLDLLMRARDPLTGRPIGSTVANMAAMRSFYATDAEIEGRRARTARNEGFSDIASWFQSLSRLRHAHAERLADLTPADAGSGDPS
ncbi:MAG: rubrerythrin [Myxococcales bacterium]|nr:rubrerythrin [Myxococcales bacterium]